MTHRHADTHRQIQREEETDSCRTG